LAVDPSIGLNAGHFPSDQPNVDRDIPAIVAESVHIRPVADINQVLFGLLQGG
jgi:hypothetical protein